MNDDIFGSDAFKGMDEKKLEFLRQFAQMPKPGNMNQALPLLLAQMNRAKKDRLQFNKPEVTLLVELLSQNLTPEERERVHKMLNLIQ